MNRPSATRSQTLIASAAFAVAVTATIYVTRLAARQHEEVLALRQRATQSTQSVAALRRERDDTSRELSAAELQLAKLPPFKSTLTDARPEDASEAKAWLVRVKELKHRFAENPARQIPELQLLNDADWLRVARWAEMDSEPNVRKTLAAARNAAKSKFARIMAKALQRFADTNHRLPFAAAELASCFVPPINAALLGRYVMISNFSSVNSGATIPMDHLVMEKSPVDSDFDTRYKIGRTGFSRSEPPAWDEYYQTFEEAAWWAYAKANKGAWPTKRSELIPFFDPPLAQAAIDKLRQADRDSKR